jgi:hypothetical protein
MALDDLHEPIRALKTHGIEDRIADGDSGVVDCEYGWPTAAREVMLQPVQPSITEQAPVEPGLEAVEHNHLSAARNGRAVLKPAKVPGLHDPRIIAKHLPERRPRVVIPQD